MKMRGRPRAASHLLLRLIVAICIPKHPEPLSERVKVVVPALSLSECVARHAPRVRVSLEQRLAKVRAGEGDREEAAGGREDSVCLV